MAPSFLGMVRRSGTRRARGATAPIVAAAGIGAVVGACVVAVQESVVWSQRLTLGFAAERRLVIPEHSSLLRIAISLVTGAVLLGMLGWVLARFDKRPPTDPVEANALRGGFLRPWDGVAVVLPILLSVACGASVGIEAAVTQIGAVLASVVGQRLGLVRSDMRLLVGAGAAAAISAAYRAPIAGMLYAYELILGSYNRRTLVPVALAAVAAYAVVQGIAGPSRAFMLRQGTGTVWLDYVAALVIGVAASFTGILTMLMVGMFERGLARISPRQGVRRVIAAAGIAGLAAVSPVVLGSGHAGIDASVNGEIAAGAALVLLAAKMVSSSLSLGGGFRGGLFSASLLIGALLGQVLAWMSQILPGVPVANPALCALVGMAAVGTSIIGSPLAMTFLVLETTGDYDATVVVAIGTVVAAFLTERLFGYSFATWRFQQRGLALDGGHDISRINTQTIADLVRPAKFVVPPQAPLPEVARIVAAAGHRGVAVVDAGGKLMGLVDPALLEIVEGEPGLPVAAADLVGRPDIRLGPETPLGEAVDIFRRDDRFVLPVIDRRNADCLFGTVRSSDVFRTAVALADEQRAEDLGLPRPPKDGPTGL
jgi:CIC family chloride channel protein